MTNRGDLKRDKTEKCEVCGSVTNQWVLAGYPGVEWKLLCPLRKTKNFAAKSKEDSQWVTQVINEYMRYQKGWADKKPDISDEEINALIDYSVTQVLYPVAGSQDPLDICEYIEQVEYELSGGPGTIGQGVIETEISRYFFCCESFESWTY